MSQKRTRTRPAPRATPAQSRRPIGPMPREVRRPSAPSGGAGGRTVFGRPWPLPVSPWVLGLLALLVLASGAGWLFEGRFETTPAEAAKRLLPYRAEDVQAVTITSSAGTASFTRDASGKLTSGGPAPTPTPVPAPDAPLPQVSLSAETKLEGALGQMAQLTIDREVAPEPSRSPEYGLDAPQMTIELRPRTGAPATIAIGGRNPDGSAYYVRREGQPRPRDTVLITRYTLDDLMKVANEVIAAKNQG